MPKSKSIWVVVFLFFSSVSFAEEKLDIISSFKVPRQEPQWIGIVSDAKIFAECFGKDAGNINVIRINENKIYLSCVPRKDKKK